MNTSFKKNDKVKYKAGRAINFTRGTFVRRLKAGAQVPNTKGLVSTKHAGSKVISDSAIVELKDGSFRLVKEGYLKKG